MRKSWILVPATLVLAMMGHGQALSEELVSSDVPVTFMNNRNLPIYVSFTIDNKRHSPGPITWQAGCLDSGETNHAAYARIEPGTTCSALVDPNLFPRNGLMRGSSRFCANVGGDATSAPEDCMKAQDEFLTMIETTFQPYKPPDIHGKKGKCYNNQSCVSYDISVIPNSKTGDAFKCTDAAWATNECGKSGPASYNLPVQLLCNANPTYTCQGPRNATNGKPKYPGHCGNPDSVCNGNSPACLNAYFYPMNTKTSQPNATCSDGNSLIVHFLAGP